jgi:hypothetical protein
VSELNTFGGQVKNQYQPDQNDHSSEKKETMTREEFLLEMDELLGLRPGALRRDEKLEELDNWDSTSLIGLIALADSATNTEITPDQVIGCTTIADLLRLAKVDGSAE